jgi:hypothetical protein
MLQAMKSFGLRLLNLENPRGFGNAPSDHTADSLADHAEHERLHHFPARRRLA